MPTPDDRRPVRTYTSLRDLAGAHATATSDAITPGQVIVSLGDTNAHVMLTDTADVLRQLLVDALAQVDAIGGAGLT